MLARVSHLSQSHRSNAAAPPVVSATNLHNSRSACCRITAHSPDHIIYSGWPCYSEHHGQSGWRLVVTFHESWDTYSDRNYTWLQPTITYNLDESGHFAVSTRLSLWKFGDDRKQNQSDQGWFSRKILICSVSAISARYEECNCTMVFKLVK